MAQDQTQLTGVDWGSVFSFSRIFKSFRMGIHLTKLGLALAAILVIFAGGRALDGIWSLGGAYSHVNEPQLFFSRQGPAFNETKKQWLEDRDGDSADLRAAAHNERLTLRGYSGMLAEELGSEGTDWPAGDEEPEPDARWLLRAFAARWEEKMGDDEPKRVDPDEYGEEGWSKNLSQAEEEFRDAVRKIEDTLDDARDQAEDDIQDALKADGDKGEAKDALASQYTRALETLTRYRQDFTERVEQVRGEPIYAKFITYEGDCLRNAASAVLRGDISGGLDRYQQMNADAGMDADVAAAADGAQQPAPFPRPAEAGFVFWILAAVTGVHWLLAEHCLMAILLGVIALGAWALFGGAIYRIAALHAARDEKISMLQALKFSGGKFLSFFMAPLIPLAVIFLLGALIMLGGLAGNLWGFGAITIGVLFILAVALGLVIAFLVFGLVGGAGLMYPTIAVEGSDSFDAISRSFSYVFAKPWRAGLYGVVGLIYGVVCYLFVRAFAFAALAATHWFAEIAIWAGGEEVAGATDKMDVMWPAPSFSNFHPDVSWSALSVCEKIGAFCIGVWVYLVIGLVLAFVLSYAASATTVIYYLLRRKVDATDLDDVFVEQYEEEQFEAAQQPETEPGGEESPAEPRPEPESEGPSPDEGGEEQPSQ